MPDEFSPKSMDIRIPREFLANFKREPRFVARWPWIVGIPVPIDYLLENPGMLESVAEDMEVLLVPRKMMG